MKVYGRKAIVFLYHDICDKPNSSGFQNIGAIPYKHSQNEFRQNILEIAKSHHRAISVDEFFDSQPQTSLLMTFDDGGKSALHAAEELERIGWIGHFFVTTNQIGEKGFLTADEIRDLDRRGHVIGSHSHTHPPIFRDISLGQKIQEWSQSKGVLEEILQKTVNCASVPGGDMDCGTIKSASEAGIKYLFTSEPTKTTWREFDVLCFGRICPKAGTPLRLVENYALGNRWLQAMAIRKLKNLLRLIGRPLYKLYVKNAQVQIK